MRDVTVARIALLIILLPFLELAEAADPVALRAELVADFRDKLANPFVAAGRGFVDEVIAPRATRRKLIEALTACQGKRVRNPPRKHGNIPL